MKRPNFRDWFQVSAGGLPYLNPAVKILTLINNDKLRLHD